MSLSMRHLMLSAVLVLGLATPALAHRGHGGLTVIEIKSAEGTVSVVHEFAVHDVEPALVSIAPDAQPNLDDPAAVQALEMHLAKRFRLSLDDITTTLSRTETELEPDAVRVYLEGQTDDRVITTVTVDLDFFPGVHDDQEQQVNVRLDGVTRTVVFRPGTQAQSVTFGG